VRIIEHAREHGRATISDILRLTGTSRNTLKQHFRQLVPKAILRSTAADVARGTHCLEERTRGALVRNPHPMDKQSHHQESGNGHDQIGPG
jgi:DeoR/GlpR family transcriptional regulator of sugar metabolism